MRGLGHIPADLWVALGLTLRLALLSTAILLMISIVLAWRLRRSRAGWMVLVETVIALPIVLPPTVIGFYLLILFAPQAPLGRFWHALTGHTLTFSFSGLVVGSVCYSLPYAVQPVLAAFRAVPESLVDAAALMGAGGFRILTRVLLPLSRPGLLVATMLSFAHTMGEFGVVLMLGGSIPGRTKVASIALYDEVLKLNYDTARAYALVLLAVSFFLLLAVALTQRQQVRRA